MRAIVTKANISSRLFYFGTDTEVRLGDRVEVKSFFSWHRGIVAYIPGISEKRDEFEYNGFRFWMIRRIDKGDFLEILYEPEHRLGQPSKKMRFISRGEDGLVTPDEDLGEE